ncbi:hypothetical protein SDC9_151805 [bioreactor metagenome]|uniref:Uncharacterized protein n=1 Tax=bioreactor metagenome TaxID=1076179 RepID=A0A645EVR0_9ZZZZ
MKNVRNISANAIPNAKNLLAGLFHANTNNEPTTGSSNNVNNRYDIYYCNKKLTIKIIPMAKDMMRT